MGKISYPQLVKNVADAYRESTNTSEPIAIGNLVYKITEAISSSHSYFIYKSIVYNEDNTITLIDNEDVEHTVSCVYEDDTIVAITLDNKIINLNYNNDSLVSVEDTVTDLSKVPIPKVDGVSISGSVLKPTAILTLDINTMVEVIESEE